MRLKGRLSIMKMSGGGPPDYGCVTLVLLDENSRTKFLEVDVAFEEFGKAIVGQSEQPCEYEIRLGAPLGKFRERKTEYLPPPPANIPYTDRDRIGQELLAAYEVDGWKGDVRDFLNHHNHVIPPGGTEWRQRVGFWRYVDEEPTDNPD